MTLLTLGSAIESEFHMIVTSLSPISIGGMDLCDTLFGVPLTNMSPQSMKTGKLLTARVAAACNTSNLCDFSQFPSLHCRRISLSHSREE